MKYRVSHTTAYDYADQVSRGYSLAYLIPRNTLVQRVLRSEVTISPHPSIKQHRQDYFGNTLLSFNVEEPHKRLEVRVDSDVEVDPAERNLFSSSTSCVEVRAALDQCAFADDIEAVEYRYDSPMIIASAELAKFAADLFADGAPFIRAVQTLNERIFKDFIYDPGFSTIATPLDEVMAQKRGVCQDFAQLAIGALRSMGFAARYVSGYLETLPPPGQEKLKGADASHAWFAVYVPGVGWFDFDPTNGIAVAGKHITTAWGRDYSDVTPLRGVVFGGGVQQQMSVAVDVERIDLDGGSPAPGNTAQQQQSS